MNQIDLILIERAARIAAIKAALAEKEREIEERAAREREALLWKVGDRVTLHNQAPDYCRRKMRGYWRHGVVTEILEVREDGQQVVNIHGLPQRRRHIACQEKP